MHGSPIFHFLILRCKYFFYVSMYLSILFRVQRHGLVWFLHSLDCFRIVATNFIQVLLFIVSNDNTDYFSSIHPEVCDSIEDVSFVPWTCLCFALSIS
jgi:hypothetical protein